jgi:GDP-L-fucose synthase
MTKNSLIYIAGHNGMVGRAIHKNLKRSGYSNIITCNHKQLDLCRQADVEDFFEKERPEYVFLAAAKVGGIQANNTHKAEFFYQNNQIAINVIHCSYKYKIKKLLNLGSSCIYPKECPQPIKEEYLLTGELESTNDAYALAKIGAIKMCNYYNNQYGTNFLSVMPTNLFGYGDNYDIESSHVLPAMIAKFHNGKIENKTVELWGDGSPRREFLFADDLAEAVVFLMENKNANDIGEFINIGTGKDIELKELAEIIREIVGFKGDLKWNTNMPNGTPRKMLDVSRMDRLGWTASTDLKDGIRKAYDDFRQNI